MEGAFRLIAHRGASAHAPENTIASFQRAIDDGADWIELDVQEDAEGTVIVAHDSDFMKVAGNPLKVWDATAADLGGDEVGVLAAEVDDRDGVVLHGSSWNGSGVAVGWGYSDAADLATLSDLSFHHPSGA